MCIATSGTHRWPTQQRFQQLMSAWLDPSRQLRPSISGIGSGRTFVGASGKRFHALLNRMEREPYYKTVGEIHA